ncbi:hypothetical protein [Ekhidna sp.]
MRVVLGGLIYLVLLGCSNESERLFHLPENAKAMVSGDSIKTWKIARRFNNGTRMNMGDCFIAHRQSFTFSGDFNTSSKGRMDDCGEPMIGKWSFVKDAEGGFYIKLNSDQIPEMMNIEEDFKLFRIKKLTDSLMILQFNHAQTTQKRTTLVDYFVPENLKVDDRKFHW